MTDARSPPRPVLVPVRILEGESIPSALVETLARVPVVVLGYHVVPDQTAPGQARMQFEERAQAELDALRESFVAAGGEAETRLVFTHDATQTIERVAVETGAGSILLSNPAPTVERVLVGVATAISLDRIADATAALVADTDLPVTVYHAADSEDGREEGNRLTADFAAKLVDRGVAGSAITERSDVSETPVRDVAGLAAEFDLVVVGESEPELLDRVFGDRPERIAEESLTPTLVVRRLVDEGPRADESSTGDDPNGTDGGTAADGGDDDDPDGTDGGTVEDGDGEDDPSE